MKINKLMGFYELKAMNIPTIPWKKYTEDTLLDDNILWTIRVALQSGHDLNLPRAVGVTAKEASEKAKAFQREYGNNCTVIYYPYFIADKSGVIDISSGRTVIEAVDKDLWNLVTHGRKDVTVIIEGGEPKFVGNKDFLSAEELKQLLDNGSRIRSYYRALLGEGKSIVMEWSFAYNTDVSRRVCGEKYLVFYELRSV